MEDIRALCFWQPFGTLMFYGKVETRKWSTEYRGKVLIVTTQKPLSKQISDEAGKIVPKYWEIDAAYKEEVKQSLPTFHLYGYAIGIGTLVDCRPVKSYDKTFFFHPPKIWAHVYEDIRRIEPFKMKGFQGRPRLISDDIKKQIEYL